MPDEVKLEPCPDLAKATAHLADELEGLLPYLEAHHFRIDGYKEMVSKARAAIEATRPTAATDYVVKELVEALRNLLAMLDSEVCYPDEPDCPEVEAARAAVYYRCSKCSERLSPEAPLSDVLDPTGNLWRGGP